MVDTVGLKEDHDIRGVSHQPHKRAEHDHPPSLRELETGPSHDLESLIHPLDHVPAPLIRNLADLAPPGIRRGVGRKGLSAKQVVRILVLYLLLRVDFEKLEFHLADSPTYRAFCLLGLGEVPPKRACLQKNISALRPQTLQALHQIVVAQAIDTRVESGHTVRIDTTPVLAPIRPPLDSTLLGDAVRVLSRLLRRAQALVPMSLPNHGRRVKRRVRSLRQEKLDEEQRAALYFDLLQDTKLYVEAALFAAEFLDGVAGDKAARLATSLRLEAEIALCICDQAERRVLDRQRVSATQKRVSMFETHTAILTKRNQVFYRHKIWVSFGHSCSALRLRLASGSREPDGTVRVGESLPPTAGCVSCWRRGFVDPDTHPI